MIARLLDRADSMWLRVPSPLRDGVTVGVIVVAGYMACRTVWVLS